MNRFKFRIWDKQNKNWLKNSSSFHCYSNWAICPFTGNLVDYVGDYGCDSFTSSPAVDYYFEGAEIVKEPRYVIQQYTGIKDKNGKEIYEGDIVKYARTKVESTEFAKGCFKNHLIELGEEIGEILFINPSFCLSFDHIRYDDIMPMCLAEHRYEVIGNVFENPELLHIVNNE
jgi:uncharacterized phage protein (TIGR01671 family)